MASGPVYSVLLMDTYLHPSKDKQIIENASK